MNELIADPQCIYFLKGKTVDLSLLKNQIDRRMLKITYLANKISIKSKKRSKELHKTFCHQALQTQITLEQPKANQNIQVKKQSFPVQDKSVLQPCKSNTNKNYKSNQKSRPLRQLRKANCQNQPQAIFRIDENNTVPLENQDDKIGLEHVRSIQKSQDDKIFQAVEFGLQISKITANRESMDNNQKSGVRSINLNRFSFDSFTSQHNHTQKSFKRFKNSLPTGRKNQIATSCFDRIQVSADCRTRMLKDISALASHRRRQPVDSNLRTNILKKIVQKQESSR